MAAEQQRSKPDKEAGSILSYAQKALNLFKDPITARNVARSDFRIADLMHAEEPSSLYIIVEPTDQARMMPLVCILLNLIALRLTVKPGFEKGEPKPVYKHRLLMALDEFPAWGNLGIIAQSMAYFRGYGVRVLLAAQDLSQIRERYGVNEAVTSAHDNIARARRSGVVLAFMLAAAALLGAAVAWYAALEGGRHRDGRVATPTWLDWARPTTVTRPW